MDKTTPAIELRDIHLPDAASIWPLAPGWWVLILLLLIALFFIIKQLRALIKRKQLIAIMQNQLNTIHDSYMKHQDKHEFAREVSDLLKRFVRFVLKESNACSLIGDDWVNYLNSKSNSDLMEQHKVALIQAPYLPSCDYDVPAYYATVKNYFITVINNKTQKRLSHA